MQITDPIADMLTRIRNAGNARHASVDVPASKMKKAIAQILLDEGYIKSYEVVEDGSQGVIRIQLKYLAGKEKVISGLRHQKMATGGTAEAMIKLIEGLGGEVVEVLCLIELMGLKGREKLKGYKVDSVIQYPGN